MLNKSTANSNGKYFDNNPDSSVDFSGLNSISSTILNVKIHNAQLNKAPIKLRKAKMVNIDLI